MAKGHNSGIKQSSVTSVQCDHLQIMETITGKFNQNPLRNVKGIAETRTSVDEVAQTDKGPYPWKQEFRGMWHLAYLPFFIK